MAPAVITTRIDRLQRCDPDRGCATFSRHTVVWTYFEKARK